jgi:hypothetical protein
VAEKRGLQPLARLVGWAHAGVDPKYMGIGPVPATRKLLEKFKLAADALDVVEANEAFAAQACAVAKDRLGHLAGPPDRRHRRADHGQGAARTQAHRRPLRAGHDVHRRRPGHRRDLRAGLSAGAVLTCVNGSPARGS